MGLLADILAKKAREVAAISETPIPNRPTDWRVSDVFGALKRPEGAPLRLIAEIKFRSPSAGPLSRALAPKDRAAAYQRGGASMVSVLTDATWFDGSFDDLGAARAGVSIPLLCKDFVIDPVQIERAWAAGADAVLVIVRCVPSGPGGDALLQRLVSAARFRGLEPFVEVVDERELDRALSVGARVIGVNARDLDTLEVDPGRAQRVLSAVPSDSVAVHLSGLRSSADAATVARSRADAALIGEALMRCDDPQNLLAELVGGASVPVAGSRKN
jgi:indole-3-glycerol phosphate synthase